MICRDLASNAGWTPQQIGDLTPAAVLVIWLAADDPNAERKLRKGESLTAVQGKIKFQRDEWERHARKRLGA